MSVPGPSELDKIVSTAWKRYQDGDNTAIDDVYDYLLPFCLRVCSKTCGKYISTDDEEASIARLAIIEAFDKYNPDRGRFLVYLGQVIKNRIIDFKRSEQKRVTIPFSLLSKEIKSNAELIDGSFVEDIIDDLVRKQEIEQFKDILGKFNISFNELASSGPRQQKTREKVKEIAWLIANDKELAHFLIEKRMLPIKILEDKCSVNRKIMDRYRKFIIANVLIIVYDFSYLKPYVLPGKRGNINGC